MTNRIDLGAARPELRQAALDLSQRAEAAAVEVGLSGLLVELVKLRVSQINGCAFCLRRHTRDALAMGESADRLAVLSAWRDTSYFDETERAALEVAERVTAISDHTLGNRFDAALAALTPDQAAAVSWVAIAMNTLNRLAITSRYTTAP